MFCGACKPIVRAIAHKAYRSLLPSQKTFLINVKNRLILRLSNACFMFTKGGDHEFSTRKSTREMTAMLTERVLNVGCGGSEVKEI